MTLIIQNSSVLNTQGDQSKLLYQVPTINTSESGTYDFTGIQAANIFDGLNPAQGQFVNRRGHFGHHADSRVCEYRNETGLASFVERGNSRLKIGLRADGGERHVSV